MHTMYIITKYYNAPLSILTEVNQYTTMYSVQQRISFYAKSSQSVPIFIIYLHFVGI